jgi:hypothetical protein
LRRAVDLRQQSVGDPQDVQLHVGAGAADVTLTDAVLDRIDESCPRA